MSFARLFSKDSKSSHESSTRSTKMNRGREVIRGKLWMKRSRTTKICFTEVVVYSATHDGKLSGQIEIFEDVLRTYQKPKKVVLLTDINQPGVQGGSPCSSLSCSPAAQSSLMATSPSSGPPSTVLWPFQIVTKSGEVLELYTETQEDQKQWLKRLGLLIMFPYSPIPEEPNNPIKESFKAKLNAKDYNADSVWAVYILPEEVGSKVHVLGTHILALKSRISENQPGQLDIISPADPTPIVTWDRDKMRRTGCLGNMVFIEIGRRCRGGPGLIWMYAGPKETAALRETLHMFLFKGDGRAVPISTHSGPRESSRASFDSGFPPSYHKRGSQSSLQRSPSINTPQRQISFESQPGSDSGHPMSPLNQPPPVDIDSHPSRHKSGRSAPRSITSSASQYENAELDSGIASRRSSCRDSLTSAPDSFLEYDQFELDPEKSSPSPNNDFIVGQLESDHHYMPLRHSSIHSVPPKQTHYMVQRSHSTATCHPSLRSDEYEKMINPKQQQINKEGYVFMQPAQVTVYGPDAATMQIRAASDSPTHSSPSRSLHPINEGEILNNRHESDYENYPLPEGFENAKFTYYATEYENVQKVRQELNSEEPPPIYRSSSRSISHKETVVLPKSSSPHSHNVRIVPGYRDTRLSNSPSPVLIPTP